MEISTIITVTYKATHYVSSLKHSVHSHPHFHTWHVKASIKSDSDEVVDANELQMQMHTVAPHFKDHGDMSVEQVTRYWHNWLNKQSEHGLFSVERVEVMRDDGIGATT